MENNLEIISQSATVPATATKVGKRQKSDSFTIFQTLLLILLTITISTGGWYVVGKKYVWIDIDMQRANQQLTFFQQKVLSEPNNANARVELGYTYYVKGQNPEAVKEFNQALIIEPKNFDAYYNLSLVMLDEKRYDEALANLSKALELSPREYKAHLQTGIAYRNLKMYDEALKSLNQANKFMPANVEVIFQVGMVAEAKGDKEGAITVYKEALSYDPLHKQAVEALERLK